MKVSELITILKTFPQDLEVFKASEDSDYDYQPLRIDDIHIEKSALWDEESDKEPPAATDICVVGAP